MTSTPMSVTGEHGGEGRKWEWMLHKHVQLENNGVWEAVEATELFLNSNHPFPRNFDSLSEDTH